MCKLRPAMKSKIKRVRIACYPLFCRLPYNLDFVISIKSLDDPEDTTNVYGFEIAAIAEINSRFGKNLLFRAPNPILDSNN
jgi:hypothetical protein